MDFSQQSENRTIHPDFHPRTQWWKQLPVRELLLLLLLFTVALRISRPLETPCTSQLFSPTCQGSSCILLLCRQDYRKRKCFRSFCLILKDTLCAQEEISSSASRLFVYLQFVEWIQLCLDSCVRWSRRSRGAGCSSGVTSQIARTGKEISLWINTRQWHFPKCVFWLLAGSVGPSVDFGLDLVTELTALSSALRLPVRLAERVTWILECQQWRWEVTGITLGCAKSPCSLGLPMLA